MVDEHYSRKNNTFAGSTKIDTRGITLSYDKFHRVNIIQEEPITGPTTIA